MHIIIDGYNLMLRGQRAGSIAASDLERLRDGLVQKVTGYAASRDIRITVAFDGQNGVGAPVAAATGKVKVVFSRPPENADALIKRLVQAHKQPREVLVVTSDQPLARFIRSCGCKLLSSEEWRQKMEQGRDEAMEEKHGRINDLDLEEWLKIFGEKK
jgi:predicted RNA-binding protein with PIN domain